MFFDTDGSHFFSPIRGGVNLLRNRGVNLTGIITHAREAGYGNTYESIKVCKKKEGVYPSFFV